MYCKKAGQIHVLGVVKLGNFKASNKEQIHNARAAATPSTATASKKKKYCHLAACTQSLHVVGVASTQILQGSRRTTYKEPRISDCFTVDKLR